MGELAYTQMSTAHAQISGVEIAVKMVIYYRKQMYHCFISFAMMFILA